MNERIKKLAEQAAKWSTAMNWSHDPKYGDRRQDDLFLEKFAELIVRESANYFENEYGTSVITGNDAADFIRKDFGVEE